QANSLVSQAWTDWVYVTPVVYPYPWIGLQQVNSLLSQAHHIYPRHAHLPIVRQVITAQSASVAPPPPGVPSTVQPHASLLVPPPAALHAPPPPPQTTMHMGSATASPSPNTLRMPAGVPVQPFSNPLPPTLQQAHPQHLAQPNPPVLRAPYSVPQHT